MGSAGVLTVYELFLGVRGRQGASRPLCPPPEFQTAECPPAPWPVPGLGLSYSSGGGWGQVPTSMQPTEKASCCGAPLVGAPSMTGCSSLPAVLGGVRCPALDCDVPGRHTELSALTPMCYCNCLDVGDPACAQRHLGSERLSLLTVSQTLSSTERVAWKKPECLSGNGNQT